jgi:hypothetical protein
MSVRSKQPSGDPILEKLTSQPEPPTDEILLIVAWLSKDGRGPSRLT